MLDGSRSDKFGERCGAEVRPVVGKDFVDRRVVAPEPTLGAAPEFHQCGSGLVVVSFDISDAGELVDRDMQMFVDDWRTFGVFGLHRAASVDSSRHLGDLVYFLDIKVHQLTWRSAFIAAYHLIGRPVDPASAGSTHYGTRSATPSTPASP